MRLSMRMHRPRSGSLAASKNFFAALTARFRSSLGMKGRFVRAKMRLPSVKPRRTSSHRETVCITIAMS